MILYPEAFVLKVMNNKNSNNNVIIATEMLLAYKIKMRFKDKIVIAIPNTISKRELSKINDFLNINYIDLVLDTHTVLHGSDNLIKDFYNKFREDKIKIHVSINNCEIPSQLTEKYDKNENAMQIRYA